MLMIIVWLFNGLLVAFALGFAWVSNSFGTDFALGAIAATAIYNICHRVIYGRWL